MRETNILFFVFILISIVLIIFTSDTFGAKDPIFVKEKSDNYENIEYFAAKYKGEDLKISKEFNSIEYKNNKYHRKNKYLYLSESMKKIKLQKHPYYYITHPVLTNQTKKQHNIPKLIWQTMRDEPKEGTIIHNATNTFKSQKGWKYNFVTDEQGEKFLEQHFEKDVLHAFRVLIPGAFKADLLRACLLYVHGGVYADAKLFLHYDLDSFMERDLVLVREFDRSSVRKIGIWNGFMATTPKQQYFRLVIDNIVENVKNMDYTNSTLGITGPLLYGNIFRKLYKLDTIKTHKNSKYIIMNTIRLDSDNKHVINMYNNDEIFISFGKDRSKYLKYWSTKDYNYLWKTKNVFDIARHKKYFTNL